MKIKQKALGLVGALGMYALTMSGCGSSSSQCQPREYDTIKGVPEISTTLAPAHSRTRSAIIPDFAINIYN